MTFKATPADVRALCRHLERKHGWEIVDKRDDKAQRKIAKALDRLGIVDRDDWLDRWSMMLGGTMYLCFTPGETGPGAPSLVDQIDTIVHEGHHGMQEKKVKRFRSKYLGSSAKRARFEARADHAKMEVHWFQTGRLLNPSLLALKLDAYMVESYDVADYIKHLRICSFAVEHGKGKVHNQIAKDTIAFLKRRERRRARRSA